MESETIDKFLFIDWYIYRERFMEYWSRDGSLITKIGCLPIGDKSFEFSYSKGDNISDVLWEIGTTFYFFVSRLYI